eukprot:TRINITY_DN786_c0_g2_i1.p1 TRINITY_DN786_c0_g2~~TRINITY_DN786_c0_g2_i1.p1  ORF type:complete len:268 (-),score=64.52 TRINITY_DN786_c0_g2_i1:103-906(-)
MTDVVEEPAFDLSMKKKKKKSSKEKEPKTEEVTEKLENLDIKDRENETNEDAPAEENTEEVPDVDFGKKKKKTKKVTIVEQEDEGEEEPAQEISLTGEPIEEASPWLGSDRDYSYDELANRIFNMLHNSNPELSKTKRYVMKPPQVCREGTKKTVWINFAEICAIMRRKPDHVLNYVLAELGTNGSVDGSQRLVIKGRFQPKGLEIVLRHYISEYVACRTCKSPDTVLKKENRLYFLCCETCGSRRSVAAIKKGFEAQIGKRSRTAK